MDNLTITTAFGFLVTIIAVMTPIIKLNTSITKLNVTIENLNKLVSQNGTDIEILKSQAHKHDIDIAKLDSRISKLEDK